MTKERWTQVQALFESALERAPAEQTAFLRDACGDDTALYREVLSLLQVEVHSLLDGGALNALNLSAMLSAEGEQVGPYRIEREIGMGGMGTVYRAERHDGQFEQTVALKLIKRGMDSEAVVQRFQAERQLLARLEHPHIARLLDGGLHADGRPYFCMEYVEGEPITAYCDARALPVEARLRLFEDVCAAVRYAHQNLVVHRDLKPSNILVTTEGTVKLLDFGIAKLLDDEADGLLTRTGERVLTPAYAAPEQVRGAPVTTATDVYALGVVLYELLTGRRPHTSDTADRAEVEQAILTTEVERPSTAIGRTHTTETGAGRKTLAPEGVAHVRDTTPERLKRQLRGDLDTIVLKALRKEPERRYASAEGLLNDLRALRANQPIAARPDTVGYRLRKYVQRHRLGVLTTAGVVLLITTLVGFYTARLTAERDRARTEANKAAEVSAFLESLFTRSDPAESRGAEITARDLLAEGSTRIENELADQPAVQAQMYGTIGRVYRALGLHDQAEASLERSLVLHRATGADPLTLARVEAALGALHVDQGHFETADSLIQRALATQRAGPDGPREEMAQTLAAWAGLLQERGDYTAAEAPLQEALAMQRLLHAGNHETTATLLNSLGQTYYDLGQYDDAEQAYAEALAMRRRLHGALHPGVTESLRQFATLQRQQRRYDEAERLIREAIALDSQLVGLEHPNMGENFYEYASLLNDTGRFDEATTMFERTMAVDQATLGPDHPYVALTLGELGSVRQRAGDEAGAIAYYRRALALQRRVLPPDHPEIATMLNKLGQALANTKAYDEAERTLREGLAVRRATLDEDHPGVLSDRSALASILAGVGRHNEAIAIHRDILNRRLRTQGEDSPVAARSYYNLSAALRLKNTPESLAEARTVATDMVARYRVMFPAESREVGFALLEHADVLRASGASAEARPLYQEARQIFARGLGPDHPATQRVERALAAL